MNRPATNCDAAAHPVPFWRLVLSTTAALGILASLFLTSSVTASASGRIPLAAAGLAPATSISRTSLAEAPAGLRAAVRAALGGSPAHGDSPLQQAAPITTGGAVADEFGTSVAISGATAVVGVDAGADAGEAYVFVRSGTQWSRQAKLTASDGVAGDHFGFSVAISGTSALVGAPGRNSFTGAAYVFVRSGTHWSQQAELTAYDGAIRNVFGWSVAISGATALVGAYFKNQQTGAAYVFVRSGATWFRQAKLTASDGVHYALFGWSVAISGNSALIGAPQRNAFTGVAYVFVRSGTHWSQQAELIASDGAMGDQFGYSVAISGISAAVGAPNLGTFKTRPAYVFGRSGTHWSQQSELTASDSEAALGFGLSVAISGTTAVVGAPFMNSDVGAAYVFVPSGTIWSQQAKLIA